MFIHAHACGITTPNKAQNFPSTPNVLPHPITPHKVTTALICLVGLSFCLFIYGMKSYVLSSAWLLSLPFYCF